MAESTTITGSIVEMPATTPCGLCEGRPVPVEALRRGGMNIKDDATCPQCDGSGVNPFVPMPVCGTDGCQASGMSMIGKSDPGTGEKLPTYKCSEGHITAIRYVSDVEAGGEHV